MISFSTTVKVSGPLLERDPRPLVEAELDKEIREATEEGARLVQEQLRPGHGVRTGEYRGSIHGQISSSRHGEIFDGNAAIGAWLEGVGSRNDRTRFKGYHHFRLAGQEIQKRAARRAEAVAKRITARIS